ncbi:MAG: hypothetical protein DRJ38_10715 [Thermoprotei archaeon]|nr:MAG: hypothetical protein DRJ38_10715 [Thermoprotei archaeon]
MALIYYINRFYSETNIIDTQYRKAIILLLVLFLATKVKEVIGTSLEKPLYIMPIDVVSELHELTLDDLASYYEYKRS